MNKSNLTKQKHNKLVHQTNLSETKQQKNQFSQNKRIYSSIQRQSKRDVIFNNQHQRNNSKSRKVYLTYKCQEQKVLSASFNLKNKKTQCRTHNLNESDKKIKTVQNQIKKTKSSIQNQICGKQQKKLSIQYAKQLYWNLNSQHLIAGVKFQYQKYKQMYEEKCKQLKNIQFQFKKNSIQQLKSYIAILQNQNKQLYSKYCQFKIKRQTKQIVFQQLTKNKDILIQTLQKIQKMQNKNNLLQDCNKKILKESKDTNEKLKFVQKLLIEKQNNQFNALSQLRKTLKNQKQLKQKIQQLQKHVSQQKRQTQKYVQSITSKMKQINLEQQIKLRARLQNSQTLVKKLEKQNIYLKNLLQYWQHNPKQHKQSKSQLENITTNNKNQTSQITKYPLQLKQNQLNKIISNNQKLMLKNNQIKQQSLIKQQQQFQFDLHVKEKQKDKVKRQNSIKNRKIQYFQIQNLVQLINLRLSFKQIDKNTIKWLFYANGFNSEQKDINQQKQAILHLQNNKKQQNQLITMKQIFQIFIKQPFSLTQHQANVISRYFVQDGVSPFVYTHFDNSIDRAIAQSIAVNLLTKYIIFPTQTRLKCQNKLQRYESNILSALKYQKKGGFVSQQKLKDLMSGLGLNGQQQLNNYMLSKMSICSQSLQNLNYNVLFN